MEWVESDDIRKLKEVARILREYNVAVRSTVYVERLSVARMMI